MNEEKTESNKINMKEFFKRNSNLILLAGVSVTGLLVGFVSGKLMKQRIVSDTLNTLYKDAEDNGGILIRSVDTGAALMRIEVTGLDPHETI